MMQAAFMKVAVLAAVTIGLVCTGISYGQEPQEDPGRQYRGQVEELLKKLNLTPEQEAQVQEYQAVFRQKSKELRRLLQEKRSALKEELDKSDTDQEKVCSLSQDMQNIQGNLIAQRVEGSLRMKKILAPEQYRVFSDTLEELHKKNSGKRRRQQ